MKRPGRTSGTSSHRQNCFAGLRKKGVHDELQVDDLPDGLERTKVSAMQPLASPSRAHLRLRRGRARSVGGLEGGSASGTAQCSERPPNRCASRRSLPYAGPPVPRVWGNTELENGEWATSAIPCHRSCIVPYSPSPGDIRLGVWTGPCAWRRRTKSTFDPN